MNTIPYSLELWEEHYVEAREGSPAHWDESRVVFLGGDSMDYQGKAYDIEFTKNINGESTLSFSIDGMFTSVSGGGLEKNYLIDYLFTEVKIKLYYDGQWYDFILKDISETHNNTLTIRCTCQSLASCELAKIGYEIKFTLDDGTGNAIQDAHSFMKTILEDTEWQYIEAGTDDPVKNYRVDLSEKVEETAYLLEVTTPIDIYNFTIQKGNLIKEENPTTVKSGYLFIPYSAISEPGLKFAFYTPTLAFEAIDEYYIDRDQLILADLQDFTGISVTSFIIETPKKNPYSDYILYNDYENTGNSINQYCNKIAIGDSDNYIEGYYREITRSPDYGYKKTLDPQPSYRYFVEEIITSGTELSPVYLKYAHKIAKNQYVAYLFKVPFTLRKKDTLDFCIRDGKAIIAYNGDWENVWEGSQTPDVSLENTITGVKRIYYTKEYQFDGSVIYREWSQLLKFEFNVEYFEASFDTKKALENGSNNVFSINQFFTVSRDSANQIKEIKILGYGNINEDFFYQEDDKGNYIFDTITGEYSLGTGEKLYSRTSYAPVESYTMYRTIEAEKSNCFNLTQLVSETFEVWCHYIIEHDENGKIIFDEETNRRRKWVTLTTNSGKTNEVGFTYGINANSITRNVKSNDLVTKLYVDYCENSVAQDGFISIQYADDNISREGNILNFDYFIRKQILDANKVNRDLRNLVFSENSPLNGDVSQQIKKSFNIFTDTSYIGGNLQAPGYLIHLGLLNKEYDDIQSIQLGTGETSLTNQLVNYKTQLEAYRIAIHTTSGSILSTREDDLAFYHNLELQIEQTERSIDECYKQLQQILERKKQITKEFNTKYARFLYEGSWSDASYTNHNAYYADALKVSSKSAKPSIEYSIDVSNLQVAHGDGYELFKYEVGDETWVEDEEYFGYYSDGRPYHEAVVVTEISYKLDNQLNTTITIANRTNDFESLFERLSATAQTYAINEQVYQRASNLTTTGALKYLSLQSSFNQNKQLTLIDNDLVTSDNNGLTVRSAANTNDIVRIVSGGIVLSEDGGETYTTGITAKGINTSLLTSGQINTENIRVTSTGGTGAILIDGNIIDMFTIDQQGGFSIIDPSEKTPDPSKIYYIKLQDTYVSADVSRGFKENETYYNYSSGYAAQLRFSPDFGIQMLSHGNEKFVLNTKGELIATGLIAKGGIIELTDDGRQIAPGEILVKGSKILLSNSMDAENDKKLNSNYGSYGFELSYDQKMECTLYSSAINEGATLNLYGRGCEINLNGYEKESGRGLVCDSITINPEDIIFSHTNGGSTDNVYLNYDQVKKIRNVFYSTNAPDNGEGNEGDIWIQYS